MLTTGRGVDDTRRRLAHEDVPDAAVLVDARPDRVDPALGQLVRKVGIGKQLGPVGNPLSRHRTLCCDSLGILKAAPRLDRE